MVAGRSLKRNDAEKMEDLTRRASQTLQENPQDSS